MLICSYFKFFIITLYVALDHKTGHKLNNIYKSYESWINNLSIDEWFVWIGKYLAEIQLFENLVKQSKYWENRL